MIRQPPRATRTDTRFPYTPLFRSRSQALPRPAPLRGRPVTPASVPNDATVLVVDDEPQIRRALRTNLTVRGHRVIEAGTGEAALRSVADHRSEEHTSELQSLMRISYAVFCLKKKNSQQLTST